MITRYIQGDILDTELSHIAHGVNCQNVMGSGVAKVLFDKWPLVKSKYHDFCNNVAKTPEERLGSAEPVNTDEKFVYNMFTQEQYGYDGKRYVNYAAVANCFRLLITDGVKQIAIPKIGCGLAGGNWSFMEQLINDTVGDKIEIWVYELNTTKHSGKNDNA